MAAYRRVYGFGHLWADCRGPGSAPEPYARFEYATTFTMIQTRCWSTGIRGLMRGMATLLQGNQELLVVRDKVGKPQVSLR